MADAGSAIQPEVIAQLRCPRCWFTDDFIAIGALEFRCARCEWPFTLSAPVVNTPAVPNTGVAAPNTTGTVVAVTITGGTLTAVNVNGTQAGTTAGTYLVPVGGSIAVAYTEAPTWAWALPQTSAAVAEGGTALPFAAGGTAFARRQVLIVDPAGTSDIVTVTGTPTGTSVPVGALNAAHASGVPVAVAAAAPALPHVQAVPHSAY